MSKMKPYGRVKTVKGSSWKKDIHPPKGHKNWGEDVCDPVPRSTMKLKFKTELRDDYKQEMVNAEQRDIQHKTDKGTYRQISRRGDGYSGSIRQKQRYRDDNQRS